MGSQSFLQQLRVALARPTIGLPDSPPIEDSLIHQVQTALARQSPAFQSGKEIDAERMERIAPRDTDAPAANLEGADLSSAMLQQADLRRANLAGANMSSADLRMADLRGANLTGADLTSADLRLADLRDTNFEAAILVSADMRGACIRGSNLRGASMTSIDMRGVRMTDSAPVDSRLAMTPSGADTDGSDGWWVVGDSP
ncbi:pentapeptide repeat-containing protein [Streptomyces sp. NPDC001935]